MVFLMKWWRFFIHKYNVKRDNVTLKCDVKFTIDMLPRDRLAASFYVYLSQYWNFTERTTYIASELKPCFTTRTTVT